MDSSVLYDIIVVGAGASGLFCVAKLSEALPKGLAVLLAEKTDTIGKKLLLSGSGQCNFTHAGEMSHFSAKYGDNYRFINTALSGLSNHNIITYMASLGVKSHIRDDNKVFPESLTAHDIRDALEKKALEYPVKIKKNIKLIDVKYHEEHVEATFLDKDQKKKLCAGILILCTGGASFSETGSQGDILYLMERLNVETRPFKPALCPPVVEWINNHQKKPKLSALAGVTIPKAKISLFRSNKVVTSRTGSLLFTHIGLSGPVILDSSRYFEPNDDIVVYLTEIYKLDEFDAFLIHLIDKNPKKIMKNILPLLDISESIREICVQDLDFTTKKASQISKTERRTLAQCLLSMTFRIKKLGKMDTAMCSSGGVALSEIDKKTMRLKKYPRIFVIGECIDIDGDTGGYNIHSAFATANLAVKHIVKSKKS
jgi:hypothetical protein